MTTRKPGVWWVHRLFLAICKLTKQVPTMDWSSRQTRHTGIPLRSGQTRLQEDGRIYLLNIQVQGQGSFTYTDAPAIRPV